MRARPVVLAAALFLLALPALAQQAGPQGHEGRRMREQEWRIPGTGGALMESTVFRPPGEAPAPLVVINPGSPDTAAARPTMKRPTFAALSSYFVAHGYVVALPLRRGYGSTGGRWAEDYGRCDTPDFVGAGLQTASDIRAAIDYMRQQPFVAPDRTIVVGQSAGGWGTLALSSLNPPGVPAMIDFAGGRAGHSHVPGGVCAPDFLVKAAGRFGTTARVPLLWITTENDSFFAPPLVRRMVDAYRDAGGQVTHHALGPFGTDGHELSSHDSGAPVWTPLVDSFLRGK
jgi:dienelactone hydrolase